MVRRPRRFFMRRFSFYSAATPVITVPVRPLPYALVPGMLLSSPLFIKAVSTIAKQQTKTSGNATGPAESSTASIEKGKKKDGPSRCLHFIIHFQTNYPIDPLTAFLNNSEVDLVARSRNMVSNSTMLEIAREDPQGLAEYKDAVRQNIVAIFQRLRVLLLVLDTLVEAYNTSP